MFKSLGSRYGLDWVGLRYMNVYGPGQDQHAVYSGVVPIMLNKIEAGEQLVDIQRLELCTALTTLRMMKSSPNPQTKISGGSFQWYRNSLNVNSAASFAPVLQIFSF